MPSAFTTGKNSRLKNKNNGIVKDMGELIKPVPTLRALCCTSQGGDIHIDKTVSGAPRGVRWSIVTNSLACPGKKFLFI